MSHTPPIFIKSGRNSSAFFSIEKPDTLVIFIHGFNGSATGTWDDFSLCIRTNNEFQDSDIFFYGYDSLKGQANNNAIKFYNFLKAVCEKNPNQWGYRRDFINDEFRYDKILIVAHSLGAIVTRRALLFAKRDNTPWLYKCRMILFAPAHRGARIQNLILEVLPTMGRVLAGLGLIKMPILDDLRPNSQTITNLIIESQNYINLNDGDFTIAHTVVWANNELVVHNDVFCNDPAPILIDNKSHTTVCKPKSDAFLDPYQILINAL